MPEQQRNLLFSLVGRKAHEIDQLNTILVALLHDAQTAKQFAVLPVATSAQC